MNVQPPSEPRVGIADALDTLRHALSDPLSAAGLKLELLERRLATLPDTGPLVERARGAKGDLAAAGRLVDLLPRLGSIDCETPAEAAVDDVCRLAGLPLEEGKARGVSLLLRQKASVDALRAVADLFRSLAPPGTPPRVRAEVEPGRVTLKIDSPASSGNADAERLLRLPRGDERAEGLFLARAGVESDGGRFDLVEREGRLVALLSWPRPAALADAGTRP